MSSPFPGMDPYLEAPDIFPDFHHAFAGAMRSVLNRSLPRPYYARVEMRPEVAIADDEVIARIVPDVILVKSPRGGPAAGATAVLDAPRTQATPAVEITIPTEDREHPFVEIRDATRGHALVTLIEIVSPTNKRPGGDREAYLAKQDEVLGSEASLIELDLLRAGQRLVGGLLGANLAEQFRPRPDYLIVLSRAWQRRRFTLEVFPARVEEPLPCIPVPLRQGEADVPLDLQYVFRLAYDDGPYARGAVDYTAPPVPPLPPELVPWAEQCVQQWLGG